MDIIKPRLSCKGSKIPLEISSVLVKKKDGSLWRNRNELAQFIDTLYDPPSSNTYLYLKCGCGLEYPYATKEDVPVDDLVCECGRELILYQVNQT